MAKLNLDRSTLPAFTERVRAIQADTPRLWGQMDSTRALRHLIFTFEMSLGIQKIEDKTWKTKPIVRELIYVVFYCWFTNWPKGLKGPAFMTPEPKGGFADEQAELLRRMEQFVGDLEREPERVAVNPALGAVTLRKWSRALGVHCDHHLRQFGV
jgi:hypothetical protein